jgi:hypothetical protein
MVGTAEYRRKKSFSSDRKLPKSYVWTQAKMTAGFQKTDLLGVILLIEELYE